MSERSGPIAVRAAGPQPPNRMPKYLSDKMSDKMVEHMSGYMPNRMPKPRPNSLPEYMSDRMPEYMSNKMPHGRPNRMLDGMSEYMPDNMSAGGDHLKKVISCKGIFPLSNLRPRKIQCDINSVIHCYSTLFLPGHHIYLIPIHPKTDYPLVRSFPYPT